MKGKHILSVLLAAALCLSVSGCSGGAAPSSDPSSALSSAPSSEQSAEMSLPDSSVPPETTVTLYADFSAGNAQAETLGQIKSTEQIISGEVTALALADALSEWSGLDFTLNEAVCSADSITIDWAADSTLIANLDDRVQKEDFFFFDVESMRWFMMDSLMRTLKENLGVTDVYYTMDGGKDLALDALSPVSVFPADTPYLGSIFYCAQSDTPNTEATARTLGTWRFQGAKDAASIEMDGQGSFTAYYADGGIECEGYLVYAEDQAGGRYDLCRNSDSSLFVSIRFDSDTQFHLEDHPDLVYLKAEP